jgi:hypothetical protein
MAKRIPLEPIVKRVGNYYETVHVAAKGQDTSTQLTPTPSAKTKGERSIKRP